MGQASITLPLAQSNCQIQSVLDQIADVVADHEIDREAAVAAKQLGEPGRQQPGRARGQANANLTDGRAALPAQSVREIGRRVDDVAGTTEQVLSIRGKAQMARGAMEQPNPEMIFQVPDQTGDRRRGGVALPRDCGKRTSLDNTNESFQ